MPKAGDRRNRLTQIYDGEQWIDVNIVHRGQSAVLNGRQVRADGRGNWLPADTFPGGQPLGTYRQGEDRRPATRTVETNNGIGEFTEEQADAYDQANGNPRNGVDPQRPGVTPHGGQETTPPSSDVPPTAPAVPPTGSETRTTPDGVVQTGRNLGLNLPTMAQIEAYAGGPIRELGGNPGQASADDALAFGMPRDQANAIAGGGSVETVIGPEGVESTQINAPAQAPSPTTAFLNASDSMSGLKAAEAAQGLVFASGQYWVKNPNAGQEGEPALLPVRGSSAGGENRQAVRDYKDGRISADDFMNNYVREIVESPDPVVDAPQPSDVQASDEIEQDDPLRPRDEEDEELVV